MENQKISKIGNKPSFKHKKQRTSKNIENPKKDALEQKKKARETNAQESLKNYKPIQVPKQLQTGSIMNIEKNTEENSDQATLDRKTQKKIRKKMKKLETKKNNEVGNISKEENQQNSIKKGIQSPKKNNRSDFKKNQNGFKQDNKSMKKINEHDSNSERNNGNLQKFEKKRKLSPAYFEAAQLLGKLAQRKGSLNSLISECKNQNMIKLIYRLVIKVLQNQTLIRKICTKFEISNLNKHLVEILLCDYLLGTPIFKKFRKIPEIDFIMSNEESIQKYFEDFKDKVEKTYASQPVRYFRVNQILTKIDDVMKSMINDLKMLQTTFDKDNTNFDQFKTLALGLKENEFLLDYHFSDVFLVLDQTTANLKNSDLYKNNHISIQDKSSLLAVEAMNLKPEMKILDACAAPGMKSIAIASRLENNCQLISNDMDNNRYKDMRRFFKNSGVTCAKLVHSDFIELKPEDYPNLDVLLLDPSCTGSGMNRRIDYINENEDNKLKEENEKKRSSKLAGFQYKLFEKALTFKPNRLVYSTCSKFQTENEDVIEKIFINYPDLEYDVVDAFPNWPYRGIGNSEWAGLCVRSDLEKTLTGGFFCAVLQRKPGVDPNVSSVLDASLNFSNIQTQEPEMIENEEIEKNKEDEEVEEKNEDGNGKLKELSKSPKKKLIKKTPPPVKNKEVSNQESVKISTPTSVKKNATPKRKSLESEIVDEFPNSKQAKITPIRKAGMNKTEEAIAENKAETFQKENNSKSEFLEEAFVPEKVPKRSVKKGDFIETPVKSLPKFSPKMTRSRTKTQPKKAEQAETPVEKVRGKVASKSLATELSSVAETPTRTLRTRSRA